MANSLQHIKQRLSTLRNVAARMLEEIDALEAQIPSAEGQTPRKRRNLKAERVMQFSENGWSKPAELRKTARKGAK